MTRLILKFVFPVAAFLILLSVVFSCNNSESHYPVESAIDTILPVPESILSIPIQYSVSEFEKIINTKIHGDVIKKWMVLEFI